MGAIVDNTMQFLRDFIKTHPDPCLPALTALAGRAGVSRLTMLAAARSLRSEGILAFRRGSLIEIVDRRCAPSLRLSSTGRVTGCLQQDITEGRYESGTSLPKTSALASQWNVSHHTVIAALRILESRKLVYKQGRAWIVGDRQRTTGGFCSAAHPTIVVFVHDEFFWQSLSTNQRTGEFGRSFVGEANRMGVEIQLVLTGKPHPEKPFVMPCGRTGATRVIERLGSQYLGSLLSGDRTVIPDVDEWARLLKQFGRPVVWFDQNDLGFRPGTISRGIVRCRFDERAAVRLVCRSLHDAGHRRVCFVWLIPSDWVVRRYRLLCEAARSMSPPLEVVWGSGFTDTDWREPDSGVMHHLGRVYRSGMPGVRHAIDEILSLMRHYGLCPPRVKARALEADPLLAVAEFSRLSSTRQESFPDILLLQRFVWDAMRLHGALEDPSITAIVFPNDPAARSLHRTITRLRIKIPGRISAISFDNYYRYSPFPYTTVDFGFGRLGYHAFHAIQQDIPVPIDRTGAVATRPFLVQNGRTVANSVG